MSLRVLITGGAGYLGSVLLRHLLDHGHHVTVVDSLIYQAQQTSLLSYCSREHFDFVYGDVRDQQLLKRLVTNHDIIIPLAAIVGAPACDRDPQLAESVNFGAIELLNQLRSPAQMVIYPSTNSGYGTTTGETFCNEDSFIKPISLYGATKLRAERLLLESNNVVALRFATLFGVSPRQRLDLLVNNFTYRAVREGVLVLYEARYKRSLLHIEDAARAICHSISHFDRMRGKPYNVGLEEGNLSKLELAERIQRHVPNLYIHCAEIGSDPDQRNYISSYERIKAHGFETSHSLDEGIQQLLKAFKMIQLTGWGNVAL